MNPEQTSRSNSAPIIIVAILIIVAGVLGWRLGQPDKTTNNSQQPSTGNQASTANTTANPNSAVKSLVNYTLPDGWKESDCPSDAGAVFIAPNGSNGVDCDANPSAPVKLSVSSSNITDCNQLQNNTNVKKHTCISLFINGHKSLKSSTEYLASSSYGKDTTVNAYHINTGKGIVKAEYVFSSDGQYQSSFDQLTNSIKAK